MSTNNSIKIINSKWFKYNFFLKIEDTYRRKFKILTNFINFFKLIRLLLLIVKTNNKCSGDTDCRFGSKCINNHCVCDDRYCKRLNSQSKFKKK